MDAVLNTLQTALQAVKKVNRFKISKKGVIYPIKMVLFVNMFAMQESSLK